MEPEHIFTWPPTPAKWRALRSLLESLCINPGHGVRISRSSAGTIISSPRKLSRAGLRPYPFQVLNASNADDGQRVYVRPGMISSINDWNDVPSNMIADDSNPVDKTYLPITAGGYILLKIVGAAGDPDTLTATITDATVIFQAGDSPPDDVPLTESYLPIASIGWDTDHITGIRQHITSDMIFMFTYQFFAYPDTWRAAWGPMRPSNVM